MHQKRTLRRRGAVSVCSVGRLFVLWWAAGALGQVWVLFWPAILVLFWSFWSFRLRSGRSGALAGGGPAAGRARGKKKTLGRGRGAQGARACAYLAGVNFLSFFQTPL